MRLSLTYFCWIASFIVAHKNEGKTTTTSLCRHKNNNRTVTIDSFGNARVDRLSAGRDNTVKLTWNPCTRDRIRPPTGVAQTVLYCGYEATVSPHRRRGAWCVSVQLPFLSMLTCSLLRYQCFHFRSARNLKETW